MRSVLARQRASWDDDAIILLGGIADWQGRRTSGIETRERGNSCVDQPIRGGRGSGGHPGRKQPDHRFIWFGLAGLGLAAVFPTTFAIFTRHFRRQASQLTGLFFVVGGLGGALIPWLVGFTSVRFGDLRVGLLIPSFGVASMIVLQIIIIRALAPRHLQSR